MLSPGDYVTWRARTWAAHTLAERPDGSPVTEQVLQLIWQHQRLRRDALHGLNGQAIHVLHPGFWNHEPGPDFRQAVVQFGDALAQNGDVEIDLSPSCWHAHHHDTNAAFKNVILHVVWDAETSVPRELPTLALQPHLDAPIEELASFLRGEPRPMPPHVQGSCAVPLRALTPEQRLDLLRQAAQVRLETKAGQFRARAKQVGWEQSLWEGVFGALGYKHNVWPMRRVSEALPVLNSPNCRASSALAWQARLLGISGLLPGDLRPRNESVCAYLQQLWDLWWCEREQFAEMAVPRSLWRLSSLRPANNPQRRLALAAHWLVRGDLPARLADWFGNAEPNQHLASSLLKVLQPADDTFWSRHWTFSSRAIPQDQPLIGAQRVTDLAINVILPWFWVRASVGRNAAFQERAEQCYFAWPKAEDNAVLRLASRRLFGTEKAVGLNTAALQQGVLQIVRDFCDYSNALCDRCQFPGLVHNTVGSE